jgi:hypothetical protein
MHAETEKFSFWSGSSASHSGRFGRGRKMFLRLHVRLHYSGAVWKRRKKWHCRCVYTALERFIRKRCFNCNNLSRVSKRCQMKTECLAVLCEYKAAIRFCTMGLIVLNLNAFRWIFLSRFEVFWCHMNAVLTCKEILAAWCKHTEILPVLFRTGIV